MRQKDRLLCLKINYLLAIFLFVLSAFILCASLYRYTYYNIYLYNFNFGLHKKTELKKRKSRYKAISRSRFKVLKVTGFGAPGGLLKIYITDYCDASGRLGMYESRKNVMVLVLRTKDILFIRSKKNILIYDKNRIKRNWILYVDFIFLKRGGGIYS